MREISNLFETLYSHFLIRDVLAKAIPGLIGFVSLIITVSPQSIRPLIYRILGTDLLMIILLYGLSFMFGMLLQFLGSLTPFLIIHVWKADNRSSSIKLSLSKAVEFQKVASGNKAILRQRERLAVLKEMAANFAFSLFLMMIALIRIAIETSRGSQTPAIPFAIIIFLVVIALIYQNRTHAIEQQIWEEEVLDKYSASILDRRETAD